MKRFVFPLAVSLCLLIVVSQPTTVTAKDAWISVRTRNFLLVGNANEKDIRKVGLKLEQFREVFALLFPKLKFNTPVPTTVVVFKNDSSFAPFKPRSNTSGYFQAGSDVNYIALTALQRNEEYPLSVIFHEYTHLLVENTFKDAPLWFNEGLAEYYSTCSISDDQKVVLGNPIPSHVFLLRDNTMLPLRTLLEVDEKSPHYNEAKKQGIFYAQSWALVHYMIMGKVSRTEQLAKFVDLRRSKVPLDQAFQQAFKMSFDAMEKELRDYIKKDRYNTFYKQFEKKLALDTASGATPLTEAETQAYLGDLLLHSHRKDAYDYLDRAVKLEPNNPMANASLGIAYFREGKRKEAFASLERAVAANTQNYLAHYYYAFTLSRNTPDDRAPVTGYPPETVAKIQEHLQKAILLRPDFPESYNLLAFMSVVTGHGLDEAIESMKKVLMNSPGRYDFMYMLGQLYVRKGDYTMARELLQVVTKSNAEQQVLTHAEDLLKQIRAYEDANASAPAAGPNATKSDVPPPDPSSYLRAVLRKPAADETQLQASLVKIECDARGIVFFFQTESGLLRLYTATFDNILRITYDSKVRGELTCGARKPENTVVVSYVPNTDQRLKVNGILKSIEFVPADFKLK